jgi:hypothetical protein
VVAIREDFGLTRKVRAAGVHLGPVL